MAVPVYDIVKTWYSGGNNTIASDYPLFPYTIEKVSAKKGKQQNPKNLTEFKFQKQKNFVFLLTKLRTGNILHAHEDFLIFSPK